MDSGTKVPGLWDFPGALPVQRVWVRSLGWEDHLEKGKATYLVQYSGLENSMDFIIHGVAKSRTQLSNFYFHS